MGIDIQPPAAPGTKQKEKKGFFASLFKKDMDDVRMTEESFDQEMKLEDIRERAGLDEPPSIEDPVTPEEPAAAENEPVPETQVSTPSLEQAPEPTPEPNEELAPQRVEESAEPAFAIPEPEPTVEPIPLEELQTQTSSLVEEPPLTEEEAPRMDVELPPVDDIKQAEQELEELEREHDAWVEQTEQEGNSSESATEPSAWMEHEENTPRGVSEWAQQDAETTGELPEIEASGFAADELVEAERAPETSEEPAQTWTDDVATEPVGEPSEPPAHHEVVDAALAPIAEKQEQFDKELEKVAKEIRADIPEWSYQRKEVTPDKYFKLKNGQPVTSFKDLLDALSFIDDETFSHHVTEDRNDFAEWVQHILEEEKLAERIRNKKAREELLKILRSHERKIWKSLEKETKKLQDKSKGHSKVSAKMKRMEKKMEKLHAELAEKSAELQELRGEHGEVIKNKVDAHVADRLDEERTELHLDKEQVSKQESFVAERETNVGERESALESAENELTTARSALDEERVQFEKEREEAHDLIAQAELIKADRQAAEEQLTEAQQTLKKNDAVLKETTKQKGIAQRAQANLKKQKDTFAATKKEFMAVKKDVESRERALKKLEVDAEKRSAKADEWSAQVQRERKDWQAEKKEELSELAARKKEVESMLAAVDKKNAEYEELVRENEANMRRSEEMLAETEKLRDDIRSRQEAMESQSMQEYLRTKVDTTVTGAITSTIAPPVEEITNLHLYKLIDQCKNALGKNDLGKARHMYNQLRDEFSQSKLSSHEKSVLYNSIRELYDDIHLAMLNQ